jgi:hypothetical protein
MHYSVDLRTPEATTESHRTLECQPPDWFAIQQACHCMNVRLAPEAVSHSDRCETIRLIKIREPAISRLRACSLRRIGPQG